MKLFEFANKIDEIKQYWENKINNTSCTTEQKTTMINQLNTSIINFINAYNSYKVISTDIYYNATSSIISYYKTKLMYKEIFDKLNISDLEIDMTKYLKYYILECPEKENSCILNNCSIDTSPIDNITTSIASITINNELKTVINKVTQYMSKFSFYIIVNKTRNKLYLVQQNIIISPGIVDKIKYERIASDFGIDISFLDV